MSGSASEGEQAFCTPHHAIPPDRQSATSRLKTNYLSLACSVLTYIFMIDVSLPYTQPTTSPRIADFTERILLQLKPLTEGDEEIQNHVVEENEVGEQDERTQAIKLLKTGRPSTRVRPERADCWELKGPCGSPQCSSG